ncbi:hypothetical protein BCR34DRAFT_479408 [Clohesyomyces aquaticus]|uniref:Uncharacterized protein n=1 Tax=Clohesyomyces aquaticus TaxID=1231657 RepID=A0A1Y1ZW81_9PLEO|nr:hypothetical protein BCR34DRAFT_479408 [Clohesyomyces aquaticus]
MQPLRRTAVATARKTRTTLPRQSCRYAHDEHGHGHAESHAPVNEGFGLGFWATVACVPAGGLLYTLSKTEPGTEAESQPIITRMLHKYHSYGEQWTATNDLHVQLIEQAGRDRVLFANSKPQEFVPFKSPDILTAGSPYNVVAGSQANIQDALDKYRRAAYEDNERKHQALRDGTIRGEQPVTQRDVIGRSPKE